MFIAVSCHICMTNQHQTLSNVNSRQGNSKRLCSTPMQSTHECILYTSITLCYRIVRSASILRHHQHTLRSMAQPLVRDSRHTPTGRCSEADKRCRYIISSRQDAMFVTLHRNRNAVSANTIALQAFSFIWKSNKPPTPTPYA
jgi:hypothetical protein